MNYERKGVTITWQVENARFFSHLMKELYSPVIYVDVMDGTKWKLGLHQMSHSTIWLSIKREADDDGPEELGLNYEISVNAFHKSGKGSDSFQFQKGKTCNKVKICINDQENDVPISDIITVQCKIYAQQRSIPKSARFFVQTRIRTEDSVFVGRVENFSHFCGDITKTFDIISPATGEIMMKMSLFLSPSYGDKKKLVKELSIEFIPVENPDELFSIFNLFLLDSSGHKDFMDSWDLDFTQKLPVTFILPHVTKDDLLENAVLYLPLDVLTLHCEITFCYGVECENVERIEYEGAAEPKDVGYSKTLQFLNVKEGEMKL